jgi:hypothetical protein
VVAVVVSMGSTTTTMMWASREVLGRLMTTTMKRARP